MDDLKEQKAKLAGELMQWSQSALIAELPFLTRALVEMPVRWYGEESGKSEETVGFGTDGQYIHAMPQIVLDTWQKDPAALVHLHLHAILHCLYMHMFSYTAMKPDEWNCACDIAVESVIASLKLKCCETKEEENIRNAVSRIQDKVKDLRADHIYQWMMAHPDEKQGIMEQADLFHQDLHYFWFGNDPEGKLTHRKDQSARSEAHTKYKHKWEGMENSVKNEIRSYEKTQGYQPGEITERFHLGRHKRVDYSEFLRKFAAPHEVMRISPDEFDLVYYTYGMELYGNMPLIEPLEYRDDTLISDFVVAIDTSGSVQGRLVRNFLRKTWEILHTEHAFADRMNLHIIQCDAKIQKEDVIHSRQEFDAYMQDLELKGFGGTDFRPVFARVDDEIARKKIHRLRGLIYFTDGKGIYPAKMPAYKTAFIMMDNGQAPMPVPPWAIRLMLDSDEMEEQA